MRTKDLPNRSELYKTTTFRANGFPGPLKYRYVWCGLHDLADVVVSGTISIQNRQRDCPCERPLQKIVMFTFHHVDKDGNISTSSIIHTTEIHSYSKLIFIAIFINGWTEESYGLFIDISLATLLNLWYFQNKICFLWIIFVPSGLLWPDPENKTQFIFYYLQYTVSALIS